MLYKTVFKPELNYNGSTIMLHNGRRIEPLKTQIKRFCNDIGSDTTVVDIRPLTSPIGRIKGHPDRVPLAYEVTYERLLR